MHTDHGYTTPVPRAAVLFMVFNRPEHTQRVFEAIRKAQPPRLYIGADGPRRDRPGESEKVAEVRRLVSKVDWPCEVKTLYRDENLGCKVAQDGAINWFFEHEEQGIILEDDCLPSQSFFGYCEQMLEQHKTDTRIFLISGYNKQNLWYPEKWDYFYTNLGGTWGWASWRRAWKHYDPNMIDFKAFCAQQGFTYQLGEKEGKIREQLLKIDMWDSFWAFARHKNGALTVVPAKSLIENIGFGLDATHTKKIPKQRTTAQEIELPVRFNPFFVPDRAYEALFLKQPPAYTAWIFKIKKYILGLFRKITIL